MITKTNLANLRQACTQNISLCGQNAELPSGFSVIPEFDSGGELQSQIIVPPARSVFIDSKWALFSRIQIFQRDWAFFCDLSEEPAGSLAELVSKLPAFTKYIAPRTIETVYQHIDRVEETIQSLCDTYRIFYQTRGRHMRWESFPGARDFLEEDQNRFIRILQEVSGLSREIVADTPLEASVVTRRLESILKSSKDLMNEYRSKPSWNEWKSYADAPEASRRSTSTFSIPAPLWFTQVLPDNTMESLHTIASLHR